MEISEFARQVLFGTDMSEKLFAPYAESEKSRKAEVALVGLTRIRIAQGRARLVSDLIAEYRKRFPDGIRRHEVSRLEAALELR